MTLECFSRLKGKFSIYTSGVLIILPELSVLRNRGLVCSGPDHVLCQNKWAAIDKWTVKIQNYTSFKTIRSLQVSDSFNSDLRYVPE